MRNKFLTFGAPDIGQEEMDSVLECLKSGWIGTGPRVAEFEERFANYLNVEHVVAVSSCTAALQLSMIAANICPGDEVITTPLTFCATVNAVIHAGGVPVLADIDPQTHNICSAKIEEKITAKTKAIIPVHFAGLPCDMDIIMQIAEAHDLTVIEDCAHAIESTVGGRHCGTFGSFGCFSFYVTKNLTTAEGGMVVCKSADHAKRIKQLALHGLSSDAWRRFSDSGHKHYYVSECGFKFNMTDIQAALGLPQIRRIEERWNRRRDLWGQYDTRLQDLPLKLPYLPANQEAVRHALHLYCVQLTRDSRVSRDKFLGEMIQRKIGIGVHYLSIARHPYYQSRFGWKPADYPCADVVSESTVSLPLSPSMSNQDIDDVIVAVEEILN